MEKVTSIAILLALSACAVADADVADSVWQRTLLGTNITEVTPESHFPGVQEIVMGDKVVYGDATGRYLIFGHIYDIQTQRDLTQERISSLSKVAGIKWGDVPVRHAVTEDKPSDAINVAVLFSPNCTYCKKFYDDYEKSALTHEEKQKIKLNVLILAPEKQAEDGVNGVNGKYLRLLASRVICGKSQEGNLKKIMQDSSFQKLFNKNPELAVGMGSLPIRDNCSSDAALSEIRDFAKKKGVMATPTFISADGRVHKGYLSGRDLYVWLQNMQKVSLK